MKLLALDTSSEACSVASCSNGKIFESHFIEAKSHNRVLLPAIMAMLEAAELTMDNIESIVLGIGPGSFVGMRIGASVAQGLAFASKINIIPVSSMETIALEIMLTHNLCEIVVMQNARMNELYIGEYKLSPDGLTKIVTPIKLSSISEGIREYSNQKRNIVGIGFLENSDNFPSLQTNVKLNKELGYPKASYLIKLAEQKYCISSALKPEELILDYIRQEVASKPKA